MYTQAVLHYQDITNLLYLKNNIKTHLNIIFSKKSIYLLKNNKRNKY